MSGKTILVVDDDPQFRDLVTSIITAQGHRVVHATGAREGAELAARIPLALAIVDMFLPGEAPGAAAAGVREAAPAVPMVCVSAAWADYGILHRGEREDAIRLIVHKPINPAVFGGQVAELLVSQGAGPRPRAETELAAGLALLTKEYEQQLPQLGAEIIDAVHAIRAEAGDPERIDHARTLAHRLHGTAGSYGFSRVGRAAAQVEGLLDALRVDPASGWGALEGALGQLDGALRAVAEAEVSRRADTRASSTKLLVVDDDPRFCALVESIAERLLVSTSSTGSRAEALALARSWRPDAVLLDVWLAANDPTMDLATALRGIPGLEELPIAFISKDDRAATRVAAARAGGPSICRSR